MSDADTNTIFNMEFTSKRLKRLNKYVKSNVVKYKSSRVTINIASINMMELYGKITERGKRAEYINSCLDVFLDFLEYKSVDYIICFSLSEFCRMSIIYVLSVDGLSDVYNPPDKVSKYLNENGFKLIGKA